MLDHEYRRQFRQKLRVLTYVGIPGFALFYGMICLGWMLADDDGAIAAA